MSSLTEKDFRDLSDAFAWRCFGAMRVRGASIDGESVSCHLMVDDKSSLVNQEIIPVPLIVREDEQTKGRTLAEIMEEHILRGFDSEYRGDNWY